MACFIWCIFFTATKKKRKNLKCTSTQTKENEEHNRVSWAILREFSNIVWLEVAHTEHLHHHRMFYRAALACHHFSSLPRSYFLVTFLGASLKPHTGLRMLLKGLDCLLVESRCSWYQAGARQQAWASQNGQCRRVVIKGMFAKCGRGR